MLAGDVKSHFTNKITRKSFYLEVDFFGEKSLVGNRKLETLEQDPKSSLENLLSNLIRKINENRITRILYSLTFLHTVKPPLCMPKRCQL